MTLRIALVLIAAAAAAQELHYEHVLTLGANGGVNPARPLSGRFGRLIFGAPERLSALVAPLAVTVDAGERIWIADGGSNSVHVFDVFANRHKELRGAGNIAFKSPAGIDTDHQGRVYIADAGLGQVFVFDKDGEFLRVLFREGRPVQQPGALKVSRDLKSVYVADPPRHKIVVLNQEGETVREIGGPGELPSPVAIVTGEDRIYVLDAGFGRVQVYSPGGALIETLRWPVSAFGQSGSALEEMHAPASIYVDAWQRVYVADPMNGKVLVFREAATARR